MRSQGIVESELVQWHDRSQAIFGVLQIVTDLPVASISTVSGLYQTTSLAATVQNARLVYFKIGLPSLVAR